MHTDLDVKVCQACCCDTGVAVLCCQHPSGLWKLQVLLPLPRPVLNVNASLGRAGPYCQLLRASVVQACRDLQTPNSIAACMNTLHTFVLLPVAYDAD